MKESSMSNQVEHTAENVEKLAGDIVEGWDMDDLINYAVATLTNHYMNDEEYFHNEWSEFYD